MRTSRSSIQLISIVILITTLLSSNAFSQDYDDDEVIAPVYIPTYTWRYFPITKITNKPGSILIESKIEYNNSDVEIFAQAEMLKGTSVNKDSFEVIKKLPFKKGDSLVVYSRYTKGNSACDMSFSLKSITVKEDRLYDHSSVVYEVVPTASNTCSLKLTDLIALRVINNYNDSLLLYQTANNDIRLLHSNREPYFPGALNYANSMGEMSVVKGFLTDLRESAIFFKDKLTTPLTTQGVYANKTASEVLNLATEKDIISFLNFMTSYSRKYIGNEYKFVELYITWILNNKPPGYIKNLKIIEEYDRLVKMKAMEIDLIKGSINGIPLTEVLANCLNYFPVNNGDELKYSKNKDPKYSYYGYVGNYLEFDPNKRFLKIFSGHRHHANETYFELKANQVEAKLGKPDRIIGNSKKPTAYLYARPYGTLHINFSSDITPAPVNLIYLHLQKPEELTEQNFY